MQQGMLSSLLLSLSLLVTPSFTAAKELSPLSVSQWYQEPQAQRQTEQLMQYAILDQVDKLSFSLERISMPRQEVVRYLLLQSIEKQDLILTPAMAKFVEEQVRLHPTYQVLERGDGYEFTVPAFHYTAIAHRILKRWQQDISVLDFVLAAEREELDLEQWFTGNQYQLQQREALFLREVDSLSEEALDYLIRQLTETKVTAWLPSTKIVVRLAHEGESSAMYDMLWRMRADHISQAEVERLAKVGDSFSLQQLMGATNNPSLKTQAIDLLSQSHPLSPAVKEFLIAKMAISEEAPIVARALAKQGHGIWLRELISTNKVKSSVIQSVLN